MPFDEDTIHYSKATAQGPVERLRERLASGELKLPRHPQFGFLFSVLDELKIPRASQMLVFSKTSFQRERISPQTPRALFFNDEVYVGYIPGSPLMELSMADPELGAVFYTLECRPNEAPRITRNDQCLECHASAKTMGVPGHLVRSFATDENGVTDLQTGISQVNHRTPLAERWGGWYVTGTHGPQIHRGNLVGAVAFERQAKQPNYLGNLTNLSGLFRVSDYPGAGSDIVALMVLEHQTHMHNFLTRLHYESTLALGQYGHIRYLKSASEAFLKYLLFTEEAPLTSAVRGNPEFARAFASNGPRDAKGRSLRDFDLETRLFKYPCSYLIYSTAFDHLPREMKRHLYQRLWDILNAKDSSAEFQALSGDSRQAILEILRETKPGLPDYWKSTAPTTSGASRKTAS